MAQREVERGPFKSQISHFGRYCWLQSHLRYASIVEALSIPVVSIFNRVRVILSFRCRHRYKDFRKLALWPA